jgi:pyrroloquinoline quinone biosynthesis protein B
MLNFRLLGTAAGGGIPQWNCACELCTLSRMEPGVIPPRFQLQATVWDEQGDFFLLNASPDLRFQIEANPELHPSNKLGRRNTPIQGIILTTADLDQTLGLLLLREFQPLTVYSTALVRQALESNSFFAMLDRVPRQLTWIQIKPGVPFPLGKTGIVCTPIPLPGEMPFYARQLGPCEPGQASLGLLLEAGGQRIAYTPSLPRITENLRSVYEACQAILVDGTFWSDTELSDTHSGTPLARAIGHIPMSGEDSTLALLSDLNVPQKIFVHFNNTNPVLDPRSEQYRAVIDAGWQIGYDGWQMTQ